MTLPINQFLPSIYVSALLPEDKHVCIRIQGEKYAKRLSAWLEVNGGKTVQISEEPERTQDLPGYSYYINRATHSEMYREVIDPITGFKIPDDKLLGSLYCKTSKEVIAKIRQLLAENKYKQTEIANMCGVLANTVAMVKNGHKRFKNY